jgi:hypothetical protein
VSGYIVQEVEGLDPVKATLVSSSFANMDGEQFHSARREARNIVLKVGLEPDYVHDQFRTLAAWSLRLLHAQGTGKSSFRDVEDGLVVDTQGRVESFETELFSKDPEVSISVICFDPDFFDATPVVLAGNTTSGTTETTINYDGSVDTGVLLQLNVNRSHEFVHRLLPRS